METERLNIQRMNSEELPKFDLQITQINPDGTRVDQPVIKDITAFYFFLHTETKEGEAVGGGSGGYFQLLANLYLDIPRIMRDDIRKRIQMLDDAISELEAHLLEPIEKVIDKKRLSEAMRAVHKTHGCEDCDLGAHNHELKYIRKKKKK